MTEAVRGCRRRSEVLRCDQGGTQSEHVVVRRTHLDAVIKQQLRKPTEAEVARKLHLGGMVSRG